MNGALSGTFVVWSVLLIALLGGIAGCGGSDSSSTTAAATSPRAAERTYAKAMLRPLGDGEATGTAVFTVHSGRHTVKVDLHRLDPTQGPSQYYLWQIETPRDRVSLETPDDMVSLASYRVGSGGVLSTKLEPTSKAFLALEDGKLTHFLVTRIDSPTKLENSILRFDRSGKPPNLGVPIAEGVFSGPLVGAAGQR